MGRGVRVVSLIGVLDGDPDLAGLDLGGMACHGSGRIAEARAGFRIKSPSMQRAMNMAVLEDSSPERTSAVGAVIIDGVELAVEIPQGKSAIAHLHGAAMSWREAVDIGDGMESGFVHGTGWFRIGAAARVAISSSTACRGILPGA
jgi:hypothetical protein